MSKDLLHRVAELLREARQHVDFRPTTQDALDAEEKLLCEIDAVLAEYDKGAS